MTQEASRKNKTSPRSRLPRWETPSRTLMRVMRLDKSRISWRVSSPPPGNWKWKCTREALLRRVLFWTVERGRKEEGRAEESSPERSPEMLLSVVLKEKRSRGASRWERVWWTTGRDCGGWRNRWSFWCTGRSFHLCSWSDLKDVTQFFFVFFAFWILDPSGSSFAGFGVKVPN